MKTKNLLFPIGIALLFISIQQVKAQFVAATNANGNNGVGHSIFFLDANIGFVAGEAFGKGTIQKTTDGAQTWTNVYTSTASSEWVNDIYFVTATKGFAVGVNGSILKTTDGGNNWSRQTVANVSEFKGVHFSSSLIGYAVGDGTIPGPIYKTTDGGSNWVAQTSNATGTLNDVFFVNNIIGYVSGDNEVLKTTNGGSSWTLTPMSSNFGFGIFCTDASTCYMGGFGAIRKTSDGGATWSYQVLPALTAPNMYTAVGIDFTDAQTGYAAGVVYDTAAASVVNGVIFKTTNAGLSWVNINTAANTTFLQNKSLESIYFASPQTGYTTGSAGEVLKTTNGGTPPCNISLNVSVTNASCGQPTGTATVVATGGTAPYSYQWTNGDIATMADSLLSGQYTILVTDVIGCTKSAIAMINDANSPAITITQTTNVSCNGGSDGAINITVSGGTSPFTYYWVDGETTQDVSGLSAGPYQVEVTGSNGCKSEANITITQPTQVTVSVSVVHPSCGSPNGTATASPSGGSGPYTYAWSNGSTKASATGLAAGGYSVVVTDIKGCTATALASLVNTGGPTVTLDSLKTASCATKAGGIYISVNGGATPYTYAWSNGATTQDLVGVAPGPYSLVVHSGNPCDGAYMGTVSWQIPAAPMICVVTVDSVTEKNVCVFAKDSTINAGLAYYNFYRESTVAGQYQKLGSRAANLPSAWTDQSANPLQHAWRYKISAVDTCGHESPISNYHKTIHLAANVSVGNHVNLMWDDYEGFAIPSFVIHRFTWATGWISLDTVSGNIHSYTDFSITGPFSDVYYYIAVSNPSGCAVNSKYPQPESANLNLSKSNINKLGQSPTGIFPTYTTGPAVQVFPNPTSGEFKVQSSIFKVGKCEVLDIMGRSVFSRDLENGTLNMDLSGQLNGIYFLKLTGDAGTMTKKIVLQK